MFAAALAFLSIVLRDRTGEIGFWVGNLLTDLFGATSILLVGMLFLTGLWVARGVGIRSRWQALSGMAVMVLGLEMSLGVLPVPGARFWAGDLGIWLARTTRDGVGVPGLILAAGCLLAGGGWLAREEAVFRALWAAARRLPSLLARSIKWTWESANRWVRSQRLVGRVLRLHALAPAVAIPVMPPPRKPEKPAVIPEPEPEVAQEPVQEPEALDEEGRPPEVAGQKKARTRRGSRRWKLPPISTLEAGDGGVDQNVIKSFTEEQSRIIEKTLEAFRVEGKIVSVTAGARVILFEWQPAPGVKASRLEQLADDLALALKAERVRVVLPLPGKGTIGIEIPHPAPADVTLGGILAEQQDPARAGDLPLFLGKGLVGESLVCDLTQLPHLLIAGTTGSGKSVCIHAVLTSLLMTKSPDQLRLILIDPKRVEMIAYANLPHLQFPVITESKRAVAALRWLVNVMDARYRLLARYGCRDLNVFNQEFATGDLEPEGGGGEAVMSDSGLPWIVVAVDELADLMVSKPREVEDALQRIAQMARGVGIHLVVATQRPSVDVVTGVIKANLPSRISFQVATRVDSRTILDSGGGEQLLGRGDMLFAPAGAPGPQRAQGAFVSVAEVGRVLKAWTAQGVLERDELTLETEGRILDQEVETEDPLYDEAVQLVVRTGEASVSMLQRRLSIGFARAGRLVDIMERKGVVGPKQGSKAREILLNKVGSSQEVEP